MPSVLLMRPFLQYRHDRCVSAVSNRLSSIIANLDNIKVNLSSARGRIQDTDFAEETSNLAKAK